MSRRRLRIVCSSDEEEEQQPPPPPPPPPRQPQQQQEEDIEDIIIEDIETDFQTVNINSANPTPNSNVSTTTTNTSRSGSRFDEPIPLDISDEDEENITVGASTNAPSSDNLNNLNGNSGFFEGSESPVNGVLEILGLRLKREWLDSCLRGIQSSVSGFNPMDASAKARLCFEQFLCSDMNYCGAGVLPPNVHALHLVDLKGPFVLQVDEVVNISCNLRLRYQNSAPGIKRCLKLSMTDGVQRVYGMEYRPIKDLQVLAPAGFKVVVCNVNIRHGMLMLVPEALEVLGGTVEEMEAARQRLVNEVNKPPRGKRNRNGVVPPLATRATLAAWPTHSDFAQEHMDRNTTTLPGASGGGAAVNIPARRVYATPLSRNNAETNSSAAAQPHGHEVPRRNNMPASSPLSRAGQETAFRIPANHKPREDFRVPVSRSNAEPSTFSAFQPPECVTIPQNLDEDLAEVMTPSSGTRQATPPNMTVSHIPGEDVEIPVSRENDETTASFTVHMDVEEIPMGDEKDPHFMLSRDREVPFTYLASLSAKCAGIDDEASVVRGKIKCFLTAVKGFQYRERDTYELRVYVDDGSLISEILIDHNVVQNAIGYSPQEVISALASPEKTRVSKMKETMKQFQVFLVNFEGTMVVEMNKVSPVPIAVEMEQGCPASDAWLLLNRLKSFTSSHLNPIQ